MHEECNHGQSVIEFLQVTNKMRFRSYGSPWFSLQISNAEECLHIVNEGPWLTLKLYAVKGHANFLY